MPSRRRVITAPRPLAVVTERATRGRALRACTAFALVAAIAACGDPGTALTPVQPTTPPPPPLPPATWLLQGTVRDGARNALSGVAVEIISGRFRGSTAVTDEAGAFRFLGVVGEMTIAASKDGYERYAHRLTVTTDVKFDIDLLNALPLDTIVVGSAIQTTVQAGDAPCDPIRWDARAPCKRFLFTAPRTGTLSILVAWSGQPELDATLVTLSDSYLAISEELAPRMVELSGPVAAGETYEVRVNAYYTRQVFTLRANIF